MSLTGATLQRAMPGLPAGKAHAYAPLLAAAMREGGITTRARAAAFLAQLGHESASLRYFEEIASGAAYEGRRDLGNVRPDDGRRYKGRGPIQLTGRTNYRSASRALGLPLEAEPQRAAEPRVGFRVAVWFWSTRGLNALADRGEFVGITRRINGGTNGLPDRQARWARIRALGDAILPEPTREERWRGSLERRRDALRRVFARRAQLRREGHAEGLAYQQTTAQMRGLRRTISKLKHLLRRKR